VCERERGGSETARRGRGGMGGGGVRIDLSLSLE